MTNRGVQKWAVVSYGDSRGDPSSRRNVHIPGVETTMYKRSMQIMGPTYELPQTDNTGSKFLSNARLWVGNLVDCTQQELIEMFKPYGEITVSFLNQSKMFAFIRMDYYTNAIKAKQGLDGQKRKGKILKIHFAPNAAIKVKNFTSYVSNELLKYAFSIFGKIERCKIIVDKKGHSTGEGIVEFSRKDAAMNALKKCSEACFFLTSSSRPCLVEPYELFDHLRGLPDKSLPKNTLDFKKERNIGPRFADPNSKQHEFGTRWKRLAELYKLKQEKAKEALEIEMKLEEEKLEAEMEWREYEKELEEEKLEVEMECYKHETEILRKQTCQQETEWEMKERQEEKHKLRDDEGIFRKSIGNLNPVKPMKRLQQNNSFLIQDHTGGLNVQPLFDEPSLPMEVTAVGELEAITDIQEIDQDIMSMPNDFSLGHCVAQDMRMSAGIAAYFKTVFGRVGELMDKRANVGEVVFLQQNNQFIFYLITKQYSNGKPTYDSINAAILMLRDLVVEHGIKQLALPRIGCGLDKLDWSKVKNMIRHSFYNVGCSIKICHFSQVKIPEKKMPRITHPNVKRFNRFDNYLEQQDFKKYNFILYSRSTTLPVYWDHNFQSIDVEYCFKSDYYKECKLEVLKVGQCLHYETNKAHIYVIITNEKITDHFSYTNLEKGLMDIKKIIKNNNQCDPIFVIQKLFDPRFEVIINNKILSLIQSVFVNINPCTIYEIK